MLETKAPNFRALAYFSNCGVCDHYDRARRTCVHYQFELLDSKKQLWYNEYMHICDDFYSEYYSNQQIESDCL